MQADVTIFLPVYNGANYIQEAISSVLAQTYTNWTFLIVDNCSTDNTAEVCKPYLADPRFRYVRNETNLGVHGNFFKAVGLCRTKYFAYLSHDDKYVRSIALEEARQLLEADDDLAMVNSSVRWFDQNGDFINDYGMANMPFQGKVAADDVARSSIVHCRNQYGVAVLSRTALGQTLRQDDRLHQAADINFFAGIGAGKQVYMVSEPAYAIRFHQTNSTLHDYASLQDEMNMIASNHGIVLSKAEQGQQTRNAYKVRVGKAIFYTALNRFPQLGKPGFKPLRFLMVGSVNTLISLAVYLLSLKLLGLPYQAASALAIVVGIAIGFKAHGALVFGNKGSLWRYVLCWLLIYLANIALIALIRAYTGDYWAQIILLPFTTLLSYFLMKKLVYRQ